MHNKVATELTFVLKVIYISYHATTNGPILAYLFSQTRYGEHAKICIMSEPVMCNVHQHAVICTLA
jgi:hypothetical protein